MTSRLLIMARRRRREFGRMFKVTQLDIFDTAANSAYAKMTYQGGNAGQSLTHNDWLLSESLCNIVLLRFVTVILRQSRER